MQKKAKRLMGWMLVLVGIPIGILILITRSFFLTGVVLPKVSDATGMEIQAETLRLSFSGIHIEALRVYGFQETSSFEASSITIVPKWSDLFQRKGTFHQITLEEPVLTLAITSSKEDTEDVRDRSEQAPLPLDVKNLSIVNGTLRLLHPDQTLELKQLNLNVSHVAPGASGTLTLDSIAALSAAASEDPPQQGAFLINASYTLSPQLIPLSLEGNLTLDLEALQEEIPAFSVAFSPHLAFDPETRILNVDQLTAKATQEKTEILSLSLRSPTRVDLSASPPTISDTALQLVIPPIPTRGLPFSSLLPVQAESFSVESELVVSENGTRFNGGVTLTANSVRGEIAGITLDNTSITLQANARGSQEELTVETLTLSLRDETKALLHLEGSGSTSFADGTSTFTLPSFAAHTSLAAGLTEDPIPVQGVFTGEGRLTRNETGITRFNLASSFAADTPHPLFPLSMNLVGETEDGSALLRSGRLQWPERGTADNTLGLRGSVDWKDVKAPRIEIITEGNHVDLTPWASFAEALQEDGPDTKPAAPNPRSFSPLPIGPSSITLDLKQLQLNDLIAESVSLHLAVGPTSVVLHPASFTLDGASLSTSSSLSWDTASPRFESYVEITSLDLQPVFDEFLVEAPGAVQGILNLKTDLSGQGLISAELLSSLKGTVALEITQGNVRLFAPVPGSPEGLLQTQKLLETIIRTLANALAVPPEQLLDPPVEKITFNASIREEVLQLEEFMAENPEFRLRSSGRLPLNPDNVATSDVGALPVSLGVSTNIAQRIRIYREDRLVDEKIMLPPLLDIKGTLAEPEIDVRKRVIGGLVITGVTEKNKTGNEKVDTALSILGGFLSGEGPPPTPTPSPAPAPQ